MSGPEWWCGVLAGVLAGGAAARPRGRSRSPLLCGVFPSSSRSGMGSLSLRQRSLARRSPTPREAASGTSWTTASASSPSRELDGSCGPRLARSPREVTSPQRTPPWPRASEADISRCAVGSRGAGSTSLRSAAPSAENSVLAPEASRLCVLLRGRLDRTPACKAWLDDVFARLALTPLAPALAGFEGAGKSWCVGTRDRSSFPSGSNGARICAVERCGVFCSSAVGSQFGSRGVGCCP